MRYFLATLSLSGFAFAFRRMFAIGDQLTRARPHRVGDRRAADHPRDLVDALLRLQPLHGRHRAIRSYRLLDAELGRPPCRDLRQVRDAEYLEVLAERPQPRPDHVGDAPADA